MNQAMQIGMWSVGLLWRGFTVSVVWYWYMVPLGLPAIGVGHALGLVILLELARPTGDDYWDNWYDPYIYGVFGLLVAFVVRMVLMP